jgi:hypothetical protein
MQQGYPGLRSFARRKPRGDRPSALKALPDKVNILVSCGDIDAAEACAVARTWRPRPVAVRTRSFMTGGELLGGDFTSVGRPW